MAGNLETVLSNLLKTALPGFFGGTPPPVELTIAEDLFQVDPESADAIAGEPRPDDRTDVLSFDPNQPIGPYHLSQSPYPGPRRVRLGLAGGDRVALREDEVRWDPVNPQQFTLQLRPTRSLTGVTQILVLYGVTAVFTKLKLKQQISLDLTSTDSAQLDAAEALTIAVITLNRQQIIDTTQILYENGNYGAAIAIKTLQLTQGQRIEQSRKLMLQTEVELKATRALAETEGQPIEHIVSPGRTPSGRAIDIQIEVDA